MKLGNSEETDTCPNLKNNGCYIFHKAIVYFNTPKMLNYFKVYSCIVGKAQILYHNKSPPLKKCNTAVQLCRLDNPESQWREGAGWKLAHITQQIDFAYGLTLMEYIRAVVEFLKLETGAREKCLHFPIVRSAVLFAIKGSI